MAFLVPDGDPLFKYVKNSIDSLDAGLIRFSMLKKPKALIHSWLAYQEDPGRPLGQAVSARYLDPNLPAADLFSSWLSKLFFLPEKR